MEGVRPNQWVVKGRPAICAGRSGSIPRFSALLIALTHDDIRVSTNVANCFVVRAIPDPRRRTNSRCDAHRRVRAIPGRGATLLRRRLEDHKCCR
jgi:hypothetical protein